MKRRNLFILAIMTLCLIFTSKVYAEEITTIEVKDAMTSSTIIYGDDIPFNLVNSNYDKYDIVQYLCKEENGEQVCITSDDIEDYKNITFGTWTYGLCVKAAFENTLATDLVWKLDGEVVEPKGLRNVIDGYIGVDFFDVVAKDWDVKIKGITIENVKTDFKVGDAPTFTGVATDSFKDNYILIEGWCDKEDAFLNKNAKCTFSNGSEDEIKKFENKKYYYVISYFTKDLAYAFMSQNFTINGKEYNAGDLTGIADYSFGQWVPFSIVVGDKIEVLPNDTNSETEKKAAEEVSSVITKALENLDNNKEVTGMSKETAEKVKAAIDNGKEIKTEVTTTTIKEEDISDEVKKIVEENKTADSKILGYFDINLLVKADNESLGKITELENKIKITVDAKDLVANLPKVEDGMKRVYQIVRIHDGVATILDATLNSDGTISFETDRFSDYILTYKDVKEETTPNTLDNISVSILLSVLSLIGIICFSRLAKEN